MREGSRDVNEGRQGLKQYRTALDVKDMGGVQNLSVVQSGMALEGRSMKSWVDSIKIS